jgi:hypothetical protein
MEGVEYSAYPCANALVANDNIPRELSDRLQSGREPLHVLAPGRGQREQIELLSIAIQAQIHERVRARKVWSPGFGKCYPGDRWLPIP